MNKYYPNTKSNLFTIITITLTLFGAAFIIFITTSTPTYISSDSKNIGNQQPVTEELVKTNLDSWLSYRGIQYMVFDSILENFDYDKYEVKKIKFHHKSSNEITTDFWVVFDKNTGNILLGPGNSYSKENLLNLGFPDEIIEKVKEK